MEEESKEEKKLRIQSYIKNVETDLLNPTLNRDVTLNKLNILKNMLID